MPGRRLKVHIHPFFAGEDKADGGVRLQKQPDRYFLQRFTVVLSRVAGATGWHNVLSHVSTALAKGYHMVLGQTLRRLTTIGAAVAIGGLDGPPLVACQRMRNLVLTGKPPLIAHLVLQHNLGRVFPIPLVPTRFRFVRMPLTVFTLLLSKVGFMRLIVLAAPLRPVSLAFPLSIFIAKALTAGAFMGGMFCRMCFIPYSGCVNTLSSIFGIRAIAPFPIARDALTVTTVRTQFAAFNTFADRSFAHKVIIP